MVTKELIEYIKKCREQGFPDDKIKNVLKEQGWQENDLNEVFAQLIQSVEPQKPKKKILIPIIIVIIVLVVGVGGFLGYKYLIKNKIETNEEQTNILAGFDLSNVGMSKDSLTRSISLEQLGIPAPAEDGDGALIIKEFNDLESDWSQDPSDLKKKEIVEKIPETIKKIAKQKKFSSFSEAYNYPKDLDNLITRDGWVLVRLADIRTYLHYLGAILGIKSETIDALKKEGDFWELVSSLDKESIDGLIKNYLAAGNKIVISNDRDYFLLLIGFTIEKEATSDLKDYYKEKGEIEKANLYEKYFSEVNDKRNIFSHRFEINTKLTIYGTEIFSFAKTLGVEAIRKRAETEGDVEVKDDSSIKNLFKEAAGFGELSLQEMALQSMAIFWAIPEAKLEHALAGEILKFYSEKSDNKYIRDMASEILNTTPEDLYNKLLTLIEPYTEEDINQ